MKKDTQKGIKIKIYRRALKLKSTGKRLKTRRLSQKLEDSKKGGKHWREIKRKDCRKKEDTGDFSSIDW